MSKTKKLRLKGNDGLFSQEYNIGADSAFVDMASGLTLEEEFKLGGNAITKFSSSNEETVITEEFRLEDQTTEFFKIYTVFKSEDGSLTITQTLYYIDADGGESEIKTKVVSFSSSESEGLTIKEVVK